jgi:hypothetical protein
VVAVVRGQLTIVNYQLSIANCRLSIVISGIRSSTGASIPGSR